mmetsp:Transcript_4221/g.6240  ORF Transcript_4221/g.6240 Transcript_4221/m.6240 type:complete len:488 (+) Transcript_4221:440-1903(+)
MKFILFAYLLPIVAGRLNNAQQRTLQTGLFSNETVATASAAFAQLSLVNDATLGAIGTGNALPYNSQDALSLVTHTIGSSKVVIQEAGAYFAIAAPQVGSVDQTAVATADFWMNLNGSPVGNSNVKLQMGGDNVDVIVCQGVVVFNQGDEFQIFGSGDNAEAVYIEPASEPVIPSIIFSMFKLPSTVYIQLSSTVDQPNGALGTGVPLTYNSCDAQSGITAKACDPSVSSSSKVIVQEDGAYFVIVAPQLAAVDETGSSIIADYWVAVNGIGVANSNVRFESDAGGVDVIISQGVYLLNAGDEVEVLASGENAVTKVISPGGTEPLVPSVIFTMYKLGTGEPYIQLSSTIDQVPDAFATGGSALTFQSIDAQSGVQFLPAKASEVVVETSGTYFIIIAPQLQGDGSAGNNMAADFWVTVNGLDVANSNVRYMASSSHADVIACQGVYILNAGDVVEVYSSGEHAIVKAIDEAGEPFVPSVIFSLHMI